MSINSTDNKFGLPKPDFRALPKKKIMQPMLFITSIVVLVIIVKMGYNFYFKITKNLSESVDNEPVTEQNKDINQSSLPPAESTETNENINDAVHHTFCETELFEDSKNNKIKKSISATQKKLAAKHNKPLVKPGTYQELNEPQGIYHLVVVSHLDKRSAMKVVHQLMKKKLGVCLILPRIDKGEKYYRVTIGHSKTRHEADKKLDEFKQPYNNIFILKY